MKIVSILTMIFLLLVTSAAVMAQDDEGRDILEITVFGGLGIPTGGLTDWQTGGELGLPEDRAAQTGVTTGLEIGYFLTPKLIVGLNFVYTQFSIDESLESPGHHHRLFNPNVYGKYYFEGESNLVPYIKGHMGMENPKFSSKVYNPAGNRYRELSYDPALAMGIGAGLFYYTADYSGIFIEANYNYAMTDNVSATYLGRTYDFNENVTTFTIYFGVRLLVGSGE